MLKMGRQREDWQALHVLAQTPCKGHKTLLRLDGRSPCGQSSSLDVVTWMQACGGVNHRRQGHRQLLALPCAQPHQLTCLAQGPAVAGCSALAVSGQVKAASRQQQTALLACSASWQHWHRFLDCRPSSCIKEIHGVTQQCKAHTEHNRQLLLLNTFVAPAHQPATTCFERLMGAICMPSCRLQAS